MPDGAQSVRIMCPLEEKTVCSFHEKRSKKDLDMNDIKNNDYYILD